MRPIGQVDLTSTFIWLDAFFKGETLSNRVKVCIGTLVVVLAMGCDDSQPVSDGQATNATGTRAQLVSTAVSPKSILENCIQRYQSLKSYSDQGYVRLRYLSEGKVTEDRAPMSVAWDEKGRLGLRVYSVTAGPTKNGRWHLKLGRNYPELSNQSLSRSIPNKLDLSWLVSEPTVSEGLSAGLGGFPPQLDLLLSPKPLSRLIDDKAKIELLGSATLDGLVCSVVAVTQSQLTYKFWIDKNSNLLLKLELPTQLLPQDILNDSSVSDLQLSIELASVEPNGQIDWSRFQPQPQADDNLVMQFVAPPPALQTKNLGKQIPAFRLHNAQGQLVYDSTLKPGRKASVLMWLADHPACLVAAEQLNVTLQQLTQAGIAESDLEIVPIWAESKPPEGMSFAQLQQRWKLPGNLAVDQLAVGRDVFQVQEAPTVVILDANGKLQFLDVRLNPSLDRALAPIVARVVQGVDVAAELADAAQSADVRFRATLARLAASDSSDAQRSIGQAYPPESIQLVRAATHEADTRQIAIAQSHKQSTVVLTANGQLQLFDSNLKLLESQKLQINTALPGKARLQISPDDRYFALTASDSSLLVHDWKSKQSLQYPIPGNGKVNDFQWLRIGGSKSYRLAVATSASQVLLLDPENREQLSGPCPQLPLAILPQQSNGDVDGLIVMRDRSLEQLKLSAEASAATARPARHVLSTGESKRQIAFTPNLGPWAQNDSSKHKQYLATGLLGNDEPVLLVLDDQLQPLWSYRLPTAHSLQSLHEIAFATAPTNSATIWAILDATGTIHLLRGDVHWMDHFRNQATPIGIAMQATGDRLQLVIATANSLESYRIE